MSFERISLRRNIVANYLGQGWTALLGIAFLPFYARLLGMEEYGLVGVYAILQAWMTLLDLGLTPTLNREMARLRAGAHTGDSIRDLLRSLEVVCLTVAFAMEIAVWFGAPWLTASWLKPEHLSSALVIRALRVMGLVLAARWLEQIYRGALQGLQDLVWLNAVQVVLATVRWGGAYLALLVNPSVTMFFAWQGGSAILAVLLLAWRTYQILPSATRRPGFALSALHEVRYFAAGMSVSSLLTFLLTQADKIVVSKLLPLQALGAYTLASNTAAGLLQLILPMNTAVYPKLTEQVTRSDSAGLESTYLLSCEWMAAVIVPPALVLTFFAQSVLLAWTGDMKLAQVVAPLLAPLALGTLFNGLMGLPYMLQLAYGWTALSVGVNIGAVALVVPSIVWAVPRFGAVGAACAWLALNASYILVTAQLMYRRLLPHAKWSWYARGVALPLGTGVASAALVRWILGQPATRHSAIGIVALAALAISLSVACSLPAVREAAVRFFGGLTTSPKLR